MTTGARKSFEPELVGAFEAAQRFGVRQTNLRQVAGFAELEPYQKIKAATLWRADDVDRLARERAEETKGTN